LMESLVKGKYLSGKPIIPSILSGASSGAISTIALNAILETEERNTSNGFSWNDYKKLIFNLTTGDVFDISAAGIAEIFTYNIFEGYILNNKNLRNYLAPSLASMNYTLLGDLYFPTYISIMNQTSGDTLRLYSRDPEHAKMNLLEVLMSSTALPIAFPTGRISQFGNTPFIDGGTGIDTIPVYALLEDPAVKQIYVLCYNSAMTSGGADLPPIIDDLLLLGNALAVINDMRVDFFVGALEMLASSSISSYSFIPQLDVDFSVFDFDQEEKEYDLVFQWAIENDPIYLNYNTTPILPVKIYPQ